MNDSIQCSSQCVNVDVNDVDIRGELELTDDGTLLDVNGDGDGTAW